MRMHMIVVLLALVVPASCQTAEEQFDPEGVWRLASTPSIGAGQWAEVRSYVPSRDLTVEEQTFVASVPLDGGLREAVRQMVQAKVCHLPAGGRFVVGASADYWRMYQVWTAPFRVLIPDAPVPSPPPMLRLVIPPLGPLPDVATPRLQLEPIRLVLETMGIDAPYQPVAVRSCTAGVGSLASGSDGGLSEVPIGSFWRSRTKVPLCRTTQTPDPTCGPGIPPASPTPQQAGLGVNPASGSQGVGLGSPGGYQLGGATLPKPSAGYGSGLSANGGVGNNPSPSNIVPGQSGAKK